MQFSTLSTYKRLAEGLTSRMLRGSSDFEDCLAGSHAWLHLKMF
jgi:hypothetical protein